MNPITTTTDASDPIFVAIEVHARADVAFWAVYESFALWALKTRIISRCRLPS